MAKRTALVAGASGLAGGHMLAHLLKRNDWDVVALSRRRPQIAGDYRHVPVDLLDPADCQNQLGALTDVSHVFYFAYTERSDLGELTSANTDMFFNLVKAVDQASPALEHVHLSEGTKWYGNHLGPYKTPTKEDDARHMPPNFYYNQQDFIEGLQEGSAGAGRSPVPTRCGFSIGGPMNLTMAITVYANICKALKLPLGFSWQARLLRASVRDAALLARAVEWMATDPKCANQAFNITNSDLIRWQNLWPKFANFFGMELAPPRQINLSRSMSDKGPVWDDIVEKHQLQKHNYRDVAAWSYPDNVFASDYDIVSDTSKARRFGFHDLMDTEEMFLECSPNFVANASSRSVVPRIPPATARRPDCATRAKSRAHHRRRQRSSRSHPRRAIRAPRHGSGALSRRPRATRSSNWPNRSRRSANDPNSPPASPVSAGKGARRRQTWRSSRSPLKRRALDDAVSFLYCRDGFQFEAKRRGDDYCTICAGGSGRGKFCIRPASAYPKAPQRAFFIASNS